MSVSTKKSFDNYGLTIIYIMEHDYKSQYLWVYLGFTPTGYYREHRSKK